MRIFGLSSDNGFFIRDIIVMLFAINYFNLLPVQPLDGGNIVGIMFLHRFPVLQMLLTGIIALVLGILSIVSRDIFFGLFVLIILGLLLARIRTLRKPQSVENNVNIETTQVEHAKAVTARWYERTIAGIIYFGLWIPVLVVFLKYLQF